MPGLLGKKAVVTYLLVPMYFSGGLIPTFLVMNRLGLYNNIWAVILPGSLSIWNIILARTYFASIPDTIRESAAIDGASHFTILLRIYTPLAKPILATMAILSAMQVWNEYLWALTSITDESKYTLSVGVALFNKKTETVGYTPVFAALSISALVIVVVYLCMQKNFVKSIAAGAVKG